MGATACHGMMGRRSLQAFVCVRGRVVDDGSLRGREGTKMSTIPKATPVEPVRPVVSKTSAFDLNTVWLLVAFAAMVVVLLLPRPDEPGTGRWRSWRLPSWCG